MRELTVQLFQTCVGQRVPAFDFLGECPPPALFTEEAQADICRVLTRAAQHNAFYAKSVLSRYLQYAESLGLVAEEVYELYCDPKILSSTELLPHDHDVLEYTVDSAGSTVRIAETPRVISGSGTTGFRTWEAALHLVQYLTGLGPGFWAGKSVVELGTGTGLVGLGLYTTADALGVASVTLTDGSAEVVGRLPASLALCGIPNDQSGSLLYRELQWGDTSILDGTKADVVVAADVTYDALVVPDLAATIVGFFEAGAHVAFVAATIRNEDTIAAWEAQLEKLFRWEVCNRLLRPSEACESGWFQRGTPEIRVYKIEKAGPKSGI